ncbi:peroxiredoxin [Ferruginibacter sp.]|nr:peroxiredoxin [Ferruginibacter sp.]
MKDSLAYLPEGLPVPVDDGACNHLMGLPIPNMKLKSTNGELVELKNINGRVVIYLYPMTGPSEIPLPKGWDEIPGARGCTPQACSFKNHYAALQELDVEIFGMSTQSSEFQKKEKERIHLPFDLLSDENIEFAKALNLPLHYVDNLVLHKRVTLIFDAGKIIKYFYPVFPPDKNIDEVIGYFKGQELNNE